MNIKVLWIDDDYKIQSDVIGDAEQDGIDLIPYESHEEGIEALERDLTGFHAVILDAKVKKKKGDIKIGLEGLRASRDRLVELNHKGNYLPFFIYTGQPDYMKKEWFIESYGNFYTKGIDNQRLFNDIKNAVDKKNEYLIQKEYSKIFEICEKRFDLETKEWLTRILLGIKSNNLEHLLYFIFIRKILEKTFRKLNDAGLLHDKCIANRKVNLSESSLFLSGKPMKYTGVICTKTHFPADISSGVWDIISICGTEAHTEEDLSKNLPKNSQYLFYSLAFRLLDILIWFDMYLEQNSNYETNKSYWRNMESSGLIEGIIEKDENGNYFCGQHFLNKNYVELNYNIGDSIVITEESENTHFTTKYTYPKYASKYRKK